MDLISQINQFKGHIFDMDGTLINSEPMHHEAWRDAVKDFGGANLSTELLMSFGGLPTMIIANRVIEMFNLKCDAATLYQSKTRIYRTVYMQKVEPFKLTCDLLRDLAASGKLISLCTSSHKEEAEYFMNKLGLTSSLNAMVTGEMVERGKPNPDIYLLAAQKLGLGADECLVYEDTVVGMKGVKNAHMNAVKVFDGKFECETIIKPDDFWAGR